MRLVVAEAFSIAETNPVGQAVSKEKKAGFKASYL